MQHTYNTLGAAGSMQWRQPAAVFGINTSSTQQEQFSYLSFTTECCSMQRTPLLNVLHNSHSVQQLQACKNHLFLYLLSVHVWDI